jgi:outer membrane biosynthesis protein TonB
MSSANSAKILRVGVIQGGKIIEERHLKHHETVTVGQDARNTFVVPGSGLPSSFPVFEHRHNQYHLVFADRMDGRVRLGNADVDFASLRSQGLAKKRGSVYELPLNDGAKGKVVLGEVTLLFQFVKLPPEPAKAELPPSIKGSLWQSMDQLFLIVLAGSLLVHFSAAGYLACAPRVEEHELSLDELPDRFARLITPTRPPETKAAPTQGTPEPDKKEAKNEESNNKRRERAPVDAAARREQIQQKVVSKGLLRILGSSGSGGAGAFQDVLGSGTGSGDIAKALAGAGGVGVATADALAQAGRKGGGSGLVAGIGDLGTRGGGNVNLGAKGDVRVSGHVRDVAPEVESSKVDREALARYVRQRLKAIQNCYEKELKRNPSLKGKVVVRFSITPSGRSGDIDVEENTLGNEGVSACIRTVIRGWVFPFHPPDNVAVAYPFLFSPAS